MSSILSVSEITKLIKINLETEFSDIAIIGEISGLKKHVSGHWYFNLKDANAVICCTMWKGYNNYVFFKPEDGMKVILAGKISVYPPRGNYQMDVRSMKRAGEGELQNSFDLLKQKLAAEGLFDSKHKKSIPQFPKKIGLVTAIDGAAIRDMISIAKRRFPLVELVISACKVQGDGAAESIVESIRQLNSCKDIDIMIVGRGGGSLEDLWAFNEEIVARAIFASQIPVISAVGHEIDFTIADFVADLRAATPSAAMEIATPNQDDIFAYINEFSLKTTAEIHYIIESKKQKVLNCLNKYGFRVPQDLVKIKVQQLDSVFYRIQQKLDNKLTQYNNRVSLLSKSLESNDLNRILKKGFAVIRQDSKVIVRAAGFDNAIPAKIKFYDGEIEVSKK